MPDQLLSTDPKAGRFLSDDPKAGTMPPPAPTAHIGPIADDEPVTLGDIQADPVNAMRRIGVLVKKDVTNPRLWLGLAAGYFGPKVFGAVAPTVARAAARVEVNPGALLDFKVNQPLQVLRSVRIKPAETPTPETTIPGFERYGANVSGTPPVTAPPPAEAPPASAPVPAASVTPSAAPSAPAPTPAMTPALSLTADEQMALDGLLRQGYPREAVLARIAEQRQEAPAAPTTKANLKADETKEYMRLRNKGQSHQQAMEVIDGQRALKQRLGLADGETVRKSVAERNQTGRWTE